MIPLNKNHSEKANHPRPKRSWVWHCTDDSLERGLPSVISIIETPCALLLYYSLINNYHHHWWLLLSAFAAPIILLRSNASEALGVKMLREYWYKESETTSKVEIFTIISISLILSSTTSYFLLNSWAAIESQGSGEVLKPIVVTTFSYIVAYGVIYAFFGIGVKVKDQTDDFVSVCCYVGAFSGTAAISGFSYGVMGLVGALFLSLLMQTASRSLFYPINALGIWLRTLFIRILATIRYLFAGIRNLPMNWHTINWCKDITYAPELLPNAGLVHEELSYKGLLKLLSSPDRDDQIIGVIFLPVLYIPALLWRWSLKSTLWLWWPIALIIKQPVEYKNLYQMRRAIVTIVSGYWKWLFLPFVIIIPWLISGNYPKIISIMDLFLSEQQNKIFSKLVTYTVPELFSIRYAAISLVSLMTVVVWWKANLIKSHFPMIIGDETYVTKIENNPEYQLLKIDFEKQAISLARWHTWRIVSFIMLGYSYILYLAHMWYPEQTNIYIPNWLIQYL